MCELTYPSVPVPSNDFEVLSDVEDEWDQFMSDLEISSDEIE